MRLRLSLSALVLATIAVAAQDSDIFFQDAEKSITLRNLAQRSFSFDPGKQVRFSGSGKPVLSVDAPSSGLLLQGNQIEGVAKPVGRLFFLEEGKLTGESVVIMDTKVREEFEISKNLRAALSPEQSRTRVDSAVINFAGTQAEGVLTLPSKLRVRSDSAGTRQIRKEEKDVEQTYTSKLDLTGSSGLMSLDPAAKTTASNLKKGTIEGPVEFNLVRNETDAGAAVPTISTLVGRSDQLVFDFTGTERTIRLVGNVHMVGTGSYTANVNAQIFVITVDEKLQPIRYEAEGKPASTKVNGGGR